jgi:hypothetical protein
MEYIKFQEFKELPKETQKVFLDWWNPKFFDLLHCECGATFCGYYDGEENISYYDFKTKQREWISKYKVIPLFTEGQLRQFIEDKTTDKLITHYRYGERKILLYDESIDEYSKIFNNTAENLLQAYWNVAIEIAKGEVEYGKH